MYKNILIPVALDHGQHVSQSLEIARKLRDEGGAITLLNVIEQIPTYVQQYLPEGQLAKNADEAATSLKAETGGVKDVKVAVVSGHAGTTITEYAAEHDMDLIVIASHRPGLQDYFLGSTAARVVRHAACAVHVLR